MILILVCTVIGWLCGNALIGLGAGAVLFLLSLWADRPHRPYRFPRKRRARR